MSRLEEYYKNKDSKIKEQAVSELAGDDLVELKKSPGLFHKLMDILDRPGNATRALLVGKWGGLRGLIPFGQLIEDLTGLDTGLNKEDMVTGGEVVDTLFSIKNKEGKLDLNDVLGLGVEIFADPLWLVGAGLTKVGKAGKLIDSAGGMAKVGKLVQDGKAGDKLAKAFRIYKESGGGKVAKTWASQAAKGERGLLNLAGRPIFKGEKTWKALQDVSQTFKNSKYGKLITVPAKRVDPRYADELHQLMTKYTRDLPQARADEIYDKLLPVFNKAKKAGLSQDDITKYIELKYAPESAKRKLDFVLSKRAQAGDKRIKNIEKMFKRSSPESKAKAQKTIDRIERFYKAGKKTSGQDVAEIARTKQLTSQRASQFDDFMRSLDVDKARAVSEAGDSYKSILDDTLKLSQDASGQGSQLMGAVGYTPRKIRDEGRKYLSQFKDDFSRNRGKMNAKTPNDIMRSDALRDLTTQEAEAYMRSKGFKGERFFEPSLADNVYGRGVQATRSAGVGDTVKAVLDNELFDAVDGVPVEDLLKKTNVNLSPEELLKYQGKKIPKDVYDALLETTSIFTSDESVEGLSKAWNNVQRYMKGMMTAPWPAFHARNAGSNFILNWIGGVKNPQSYAEALSLLRNKGVKITTGTGQVLEADEIMKLAKENGILNRSIGMFAADELGDKMIDVPKGMVKRHFTGKGPVMKAGRSVGNAVENHARMAHFIDKLKKGYNPADAASSVKKVLFDYGDLTEFEKKVMRDKGVFFYTFMRKNLPLQLKTLATDPGKQAVFSHIMGGTPEIRGNEAQYPDWWRERLVSRPLGFNVGEGKEVRIAGMGTPIEEAFGSFAGPGYSAVDSISRIAQRQFSKLSPIVTTPVEAVTGKDLYYGKDIADTGYAPKWTEKLPRVVKKPLGIKTVQAKDGDTYNIMNPRARWAISKSPLSRTWSSSAMLSEKQNPLITTSNMFLGIKPRIYDPERQAELVAKERAEQTLKEKFRQGEIKQYKRFYTPKGTDPDKETEMLLKMQ